MHYSADCSTLKVKVGVSSSPYAAPLHSRTASSRKKLRSQKRPAAVTERRLRRISRSFCLCCVEGGTVKMIVKEYRIVLPLSVEEYQVAQLYSVAEASRNETGGGEGVKVLRNEPYEKDGEKGQYTKKEYYLKSRVPSIVSNLAPKDSLVVVEEAWNAYPYCRTILTNKYMDTKFEIKIETWHKPDMGDQENVHGLTPEEWKDVEVVDIDIADNSAINAKDYKEDEDPAKFKSEKTGRGPLGPNWKKELAESSSCPHMCAYKLVTIKFKMLLIGGEVEKIINKMEKRVFTNFHRQLYCWMDKWHGLTMEDIRRIEDETQKELDEMRDKGEVRGTSCDDN